MVKKCEFLLLFSQQTKILYQKLVELLIFFFSLLLPKKTKYSRRRRRRVEVEILII